ncbi:MAG: DUF1304 domain-containing protein [Pseudomonadota bacterium]
MKRIALVLLALVAVLHLYIAWFEIFAWTTRGPVVFDTLPPDLFEPTTQIAANQGVYNAFLAAGLIWSLFIQDPRWQFNVALCFLGFVFIAGVAAAVTIAVSTGLPQMVSAGIAGAALLLMNRRTG